MLVVLVTLALIAAVAIVSTVVVATRDGYRRTPAAHR